LRNLKLSVPLSYGVRVKGQSKSYNTQQEYPAQEEEIDDRLSLASTPTLRQRAWRELNRETLDIEIIAKVRHCAHTGLVPGTEKFREQVSKTRT
jgi:hypothetical protein